MKGLCHKCLSSNVVTVISKTTGKPTCMYCLGIKKKVESHICTISPDKLECKICGKSLNDIIDDGALI